MITWKNYEEYMMMHADGELKPAEEQELMSFLFDHPELQSELTAFSMAKMKPDTKLVFAKKEALLKPIPATRVIAFAPWKRYAIAAGVAAILVLSFLKLSTNSSNNTPVLAKTEVVEPATVTPQNSNPEPAIEIKKEAVPAPTAIAAATQKQTAVKHKAVKVSSAIHNTQPAATAFVATTETIDRMAPATIKKYEESPKIIAATVTNVPTAAIYTDNDTEDKSFLDKLPINELKKQGMETVATALASGYDKVNTVRQGISESSITLRVEKRKLIVSF